LKKVQEELKGCGILAYEATGTTEEKLAEMVDKMQFTAANPEPAPEAKNLLGNLLRRNLLWVTLLKAKYGPHSPWKKHRLIYAQARSDSTCFPRHIRQATCHQK